MKTHWKSISCRPAIRLQCLAQRLILSALERTRDLAFAAWRVGVPNAGVLYARCVDRLCILNDRDAKYGTLRWKINDEMRVAPVDGTIDDATRTILGLPTLVALQSNVAEHNRKRAADRYVAGGLPEGVSMWRVLPPWTIEDIRARLGDAESAVWADGEDLTFVCRSNDEDIHLTGGIQMRMWRMPESDLWTITLRIRDLPRAVITYQFISYKDGHPVWTQPMTFQQWRGDQAPPPIEQAERLQGLIRQHTLESAALGEPRELTIYLPPGHDRSRPAPVVYAADGESVATLAYGIEPLIARGALPPVALVGVHSGTAPNEDRRAQEYLPGRDTGRFEAHRHFFVAEVSAWAEEHVSVATDRERRAVFGFSNGAAFAVAMGLRHPERFGNVLAFSLSQRLDSPNWPAHLAPRHYLVAGTLEEGFREGTARWANTLADLGVAHIHRERVCGHDFIMWDEEFPGAVVWAFG